MLTHPSLEASTNKDISAWITENTRYNKCILHQITAGNTHAYCNIYLSEVVKVVLVVDPLVVGLQTVWLVGDVFDIGAEAVEEFAFKQLPVEEKSDQAFDAIWLFT